MALFNTLDEVDRAEQAGLLTKPIADQVRATIIPPTDVAPMVGAPEDAPLRQRTLETLDRQTMPLPTDEPVATNPNLLGMPAAAHDINVKSGARQGSWLPEGQTMGLPESAKYK